MTRVRDRAEIGVIVIGDDQLPLFVNDEAIRILAYPGDPVQPISPGALVRRFLAGMRESLQQSSASLQFQSGRRQYTCQFAWVESCDDPNCKALAVSLERANVVNGHAQSAFEYFHLTERERQVTTLLLHGLSEKEVAERLQLSPNTVHAFARTVRAKTGTSSRTELVLKVLSSR